VLCHTPPQAVRCSQRISITGGRSRRHEAHCLFLNHASTECVFFDGCLSDARRTKKNQSEVGFEEDRARHKWQRYITSKSARRFLTFGILRRSLCSNLSDSSCSKDLEKQRSIHWFAREIQRQSRQRPKGEPQICTCCRFLYAHTLEWARGFEEERGILPHG